VASWSQSSGPGGAARPAADPVNSSKFYAYDADGGQFFVSTNAGLSFAATVDLGGGGSERISAAPGVEGDVWIALHGRGLTRTTDSGTSFQAVSAVTRCGAVGFGAPAPGLTYPSVYIWGVIGGVTGVHRSDDAGASWVRINDDAHEYGGSGNGHFVMGDANLYGRVYLSTAGRGIAYGEIAD
jgi:hypothetical protein